MGKSREGQHQAAVVPFQIAPLGGIDVLLIRRRTRSRWGIPKGWVEAGQSDADAAMREAVEEAGALGELSPRPLIEFDRDKRGHTRRVVVFLLRVLQLRDDYPEQALRDRAWFSVTEAATQAKTEPIRELIARLPNLIRRGPNGRVAFVPVRVMPRKDDA